MGTHIIALFTILAFLGPYCAAASDFEDSNTSIEQEDMKTIDQVNDENSIEDETEPVEQEDMKTIDQVNDESSIEDENTPVEQEDIKTIDQVNE